MRLRVRLSLLFVFALTTHALWSLTAGVYIVGNCKPTLPSFTTISAALAATPAPTTIQVCPGTYNEQVEIDIPVTLQGITSGNSGQAIIAPPPGGMVVNASNENSSPVAAQIWVNSVVGAVTISDLTVDATGNGITAFPPWLVGVFFQNSSGTLNRVVTRNQNGLTSGVGIWVEGGVAAPRVTVENSSVHDFNFLGIASDTSNSSLTLILQNNDIDGEAGQGGIDSFQGVAITITGNRVKNAANGIIANGSIGTISNNVLTDDTTGINVEDADEVSVTGNKISGASTGVFLFQTLGPITGNTIAEGVTGIDFSCNSDVNVHGNIINDVATGLAHVPSVTSTNTYLNVGTIRTGC
jgi:hypothetical protein